MIDLAMSDKENNMYAIRDYWWLDYIFVCDIELLISLCSYIIECMNGVLGAILYL